jgi:Ser/Thr protein kinase RdoA (MazF antagonist)
MAEALPGRTAPCRPAPTAEEIVEAALAGAIVTRRPYPYATSSLLEDLEVQQASGATVHLVAKHLGRAEMTAAARRAKPATLHCAGRELAVYRHILADAGLATPALIGGWADDDRGVLVVERVDGIPLAQIGGFSMWEATARWLARMHTKFADQLPVIPAVPDPRPSLVRYDLELLGAAGREGLRRADEEQLGSAEVRGALRSCHERALKVLVSADPTLVHGDFYPSNILIAGARTAVVDWELAGTGPGVLDLAALVAGRWTSAQRQHLTLAYHEEAALLGPAVPLSQLRRDLELASVHVALCWVGSAPGWDAPEGHRRDWFADAVASLGRLDGLG